MSTFSIESTATWAEPGEDRKLVQWAEVKIIIPKDFDWKADSEKLLERLKFAVSLIGRGDST